MIIPKDYNRISIKESTELPKKFMAFDNLMNLKGITWKAYIPPSAHLVLGAVATLNFVQKPEISYDEIDSLIGGIGKADRRRLEQIDRWVTEFRAPIFLASGIYSEGNQEIDYNNCMISGCKITYRKQGETLTYVNNAEVDPILLRYAESSGHLFIVDSELLKAPIDQTETAIAVELTLLSIIERARKQGKETEDITVSAISKKVYDYMFYEEKIEEILFSLLDFYASKRLNITKYEVLDKYKERIRIYLTTTDI